MNKTLEATLKIIDNYLADRRGIRVGQSYTLEELRALPSFGIGRTAHNFHFMDFIEKDKSYKVHLYKDSGQYWTVMAIYEQKQVDGIELKL